MRSKQPEREYFEERCSPEPNSGCWLWTGPVDKNGYGDITAKHIRIEAPGWKYARKRKKAHRVSWEIHHGPIPHGFKVLHRCDVPGCVNPEHLFLGTPKDNTADMVAKRRHYHGDRCASSRLTEEQVLAIRGSSETQRELAKRYGVHFGTINDIVRHRTWKHLL